MAPDATASADAGTTEQAAPTASTVVPVVEPTQQVESSDAAETATEGDVTKRRRRRRGGRGRSRAEQGGEQAGGEQGPADATVSSPTAD